LGRRRGLGRDRIFICRTRTTQQPGGRRCACLSLPRPSMNARDRVVKEYLGLVTPAVAHRSPDGDERAARPRDDVPIDQSCTRRHSDLDRILVHSRGCGSGKLVGRSPRPGKPVARPRGRLVSPERVLEIQQFAREPISLHQTIRDDGDSQLGDFVEDFDALTPSRSHAAGPARAGAADAVREGGGRGPGRFGLTDGRSRTSRHPSRSQLLRDYLDQPELVSSQPAEYACRQPSRTGVRMRGSGSAGTVAVTSQTPACRSTSSMPGGSRMSESARRPAGAVGASTSLATHARAGRSWSSRPTSWCRC
jgi:hypothetical protein